MSRFVLRSYEFRREREQSWLELESIVKEAEARGLGRLSADKLLRLPGLYRAALSSLSVARSISLDRNVVSYLESLSARAYFLVYGARADLLDTVLQFFHFALPDAVRAAKWHILVAALFLFLGGLTGFLLTLGNEDWYYTLMPAGLAGGRLPTSSTEELRDALYLSEGALLEQLQAFASFLFTHNAKIGMMCFALGFAFGVPTLLLVFQNGLVLGSFAALYHARGLSAELWAWLCVHGTTEFLAVLLCAGAGLMLGTSLAFPGRHRRLDNLARNGRMASRIVIGAVLLFFVAGLLEGFARQLVLDVDLRYLIGVGALCFWLVYFTRSGLTLRARTA